ncbi:peptide chain release factor N(5)-glutamine methyltransferase [Legionella fairfieldensis]|uniref:peptide chain release factor N(5)-glutamine methyltransferase n=1 Tax=Legionella fairfieldensis TaxID=45064 RepID=UPI00048BD9B3|nr:peptide chain release factor N(5)-glutamine methyltransferase [Legionella fairfieldensis]
MIEAKTALIQATHYLEIYSETARLDAEILLAHVTRTTRTYLYAHPEIILTKTQWQTFQQLTEQRAQGKPVAYLTGHREFWSLPLKVCGATLIPRPETELLVELTLLLLADKPDARILDLGTGSGAIALALASERPGWEITACDYSADALQIAKENAASLNFANVCFYQSNWFEAIDDKKRFDAIVSNPPYISANDPHLTQGDLRFEPQLALVSGEDGLSALKHLIQHSLARLQAGGLLLLEHGFDQKLAVESMLHNYGYQQVQCWQDWQGQDRVSGGRR